MIESVKEGRFWLGASARWITGQIILATSGLILSDSFSGYVRSLRRRECLRRRQVDDDAAEPRLGHKDRRLPSSATTPSPDTPVTDAYVAD